MTSVGNDVVDLKHIDKQRTCTPKFYSKILSPAEQQLHNRHPQLPFECFVWLLWSVKESAYKYLQRHQPSLVFSPVKIKVESIDIPLKAAPLFILDEVTCNGFNEPWYYKAEVYFNNQQIYARSVIYGDELINTVVCLEDDFDRVHWGVKLNETAYQSAAVRSFLSNQLSVLFSGNTVSVTKNAAGVPSVSINKNSFPVSLSHHGGYIAYAYCADLTNKVKAGIR